MPGYVFGIAGALLWAIAFLVAGDTGVYATAAWFVVCFAIAVETRGEKFLGKLLFTLLVFLLSAGGVAIVINSVMASPFDFHFWRDSLAQVAAYRWATPAAMTAMGEVHLLSALLIGIVIFLVRAQSRKGNRAVTQRTGFLLGGFVFALAMLQSALVRSDIGHVIIGEFALTFFVSTILFSFSGRASLAGVVVAIAASMLFSHPIFRPSSVIRLYGQLRNPLTECPPGYNEFDRACYQEPLTPQMLTAAAGFLQAHSRANDSIFVFPYQTMFGLASRRNVAGGLMQAYTASGAYLSQLEIAGLERHSARGRALSARCRPQSLVADRHCALVAQLSERSGGWRPQLHPRAGGLVLDAASLSHRRAADAGRGRVGARRFARLAHYDANPAARPGGADLRDQPAQLDHRSGIAQLAQRLRFFAIAAYGSLPTVVETA